MLNNTAIPIKPAMTPTQANARNAIKCLLFFDAVTGVFGDLDSAALICSISSSRLVANNDPYPVFFIFQA